MPLIFIRNVCKFEFLVRKCASAAKTQVRTVNTKVTLTIAFPLLKNILFQSYHPWPRFHEKLYLSDSYRKS